MKTTYSIIYPTSIDKKEVDWPAEPGFGLINELITPILGGKSRNLEHVSVLHNGKPTDMFVDECGAIDGLPRNEVATSIYRAYARSRNPRIDPESLAAIYGTAILFDRRVWF